MEKKSPLKLTPAFRANVVGACGERGRRWLDELPEIIERVTEMWELSAEDAFGGLTYNYVAPCVTRADGKRCVLKIGLPEKDDSLVANEAEFLKLAGGEGAVRLLRFDPNYRALLLERLTPGETLKGLCAEDDARATCAAVEILRRIRRSAPQESRFPTLGEWIENFQKAKTGTLAAASLKKAQNYFAELVGSSAQSLLLHGDFHHQNILSAEREPFLAIDPKGLIGDLGFEISVFLNNPRGWLLSRSDRSAIAIRRLEIFAGAFAIEMNILRKWAFAEAVLTAWWSVEEGGEGSKKWLACAEIWETLDAGNKKI